MPARLREIGGRALALMVVVVLAGVLASGCGGGGGYTQSKELTIGNIGWDENIAISNLTKVLLEEELGYENVELRTADVDALFEGVGSGELDAFQDVWMPNHEEYLSEVESDVEHLDPWFRGTTKFSLAVPTYVKTDGGENVTSIAQLNRTDAEQIIGIEPSTVIMQRIPEEVTSRYDLRQDLIEAPTAGMLAEVETRYNAREPFAFVAWSPHWMNQRYDFNYLEDPKGALGDLTQPSELSTIVREDLREDDPAVYAFMDAMIMTEQQVNDLEQVIQDNDADPITGARVWLENNHDVVQPWVDAARRARQS